MPKVDRFTELGRRRNNVELDGEYRRLLLRDHNPFAFLYNGRLLQVALPYQLHPFSQVFGGAGQPTNQHTYSSN